MLHGECFKCEVHIFFALALDRTETSDSFKRGILGISIKEGVKRSVLVGDSTFIKKFSLLNRDDVMQLCERVSNQWLLIRFNIL